MNDIEKAEEYSKNNNQRIQFLLEKTKKEIKTKCRKFKLYSKYLTFLKELYKQDAFFPKLEIRFYSDDNRGVVSKASIKQNEIIMIIPKSCLISLELAMSSDIGKEMSKFMYQELRSPKHCLLTAYMLSELNKDKWKFYFDLLPKDFNNFPIFYTERELDLLKGSPFLTQIYEKKLEIKMDYEKICFYIPSFNQYSYNQFCESRMLISSRIFGIRINNTKTDVLVPFADLLNHRRPKQTQWYYDNNLNAFVIQAIEDIPEGYEIFDSYGKKTNSRFLMGYGFALENNDTGEYPLTICFNENCPQFQIKKNFFQKEIDYFRTFKLNNIIYESELMELLSFLRFLLFDEEDIDLLYNAMSSQQNYLYDGEPLSFYYIAPITKALEIKVLKQFLFFLREALGKYPTSLEEDKHVLKTEKNISFNMKNCLLLLMSEKSVLLYFIEFCEYCLGLFNLSKLEIISKISVEFKEEECPFDWYIQQVILKLIKEEQ